ncbi:DUF948 domain-containing protein [Haloglycomyces albus]|uniref:DUF948 domain-containing protein n=1 Tax=Haloglycomyces albus TaxID=526067 RepID=UPI00046D46AD|nr:DUF948 domain-containing protein [Haloglycomyces albus]
MSANHEQLPHLAAESTSIAVWEWGVLAAGVGLFLFLLIFAFGVIGKIGKSLDKTNKLLDDVDHRVGPMLDNTNKTITLVNANLSQTESELAKVGGMTDNVVQVTNNVTNMTSMITSALASPLIKAASFAFGLRKTMKQRDDDYQEAQIRAALSAAEEARRDHKRRSRKDKKQK